MAISLKPVLADTDEIAGRLDDPALRILDVDEDTTAFATGHIPGAQGIHWKDDLQDPVRRQFIGLAAFERLMDRLGIRNDSEVVLYGGTNNWFAAYAFWYFRYYGHEAVRLMDGGRKKWLLEDRPMTASPTPPAPTSGYRVPGTRDEIRALRAYVADEVLGGSGFELVDVRSPEEFRGELLAPPHLPQEQAQRPGHIPGARNIPWAKAVDQATGAFLPVEQLRALYEGQGVTPDREVVAYCRIGERSAHSWFVLTQLLGYPNVRNYDGSWTEWGSLVGAPIEKGA